MVTLRPSDDSKNVCRVAKGIFIGAVVKLGGKSNKYIAGPFRSY